MTRDDGQMNYRAKGIRRHHTPGETPATAKENQP